MMNVKLHFTRELQAIHSNSILIAEKTFVTYACQHSPQVMKIVAHAHPQTETGSNPLLKDRITAESAAHLSRNAILLLKTRLFRSLCHRGDCTAHNDDEDEGFDS